MTAGMAAHTYECMNEVIVLGKCTGMAHCWQRHILKVFAVIPLLLDADSASQSRVTVAPIRAAAACWQIHERHTMPG